MGLGAHKLHDALTNNLKGHPQMISFQQNPKLAPPAGGAPSAGHTVGGHTSGILRQHSLGWGRLPHAPPQTLPCLLRVLDPESWEDPESRTPNKPDTTTRAFLGTLPRVSEEGGQDYDSELLSERTSQIGPKTLPGGSRVVIGFRF